MGKNKGRVQKHATRAKSARGSDAEESESGHLSGTSSENNASSTPVQRFGRLSQNPSVWLAKSPTTMRLTNMMQMMMVMILTPRRWARKKAKKSRAGSKVHLHCKLPDGTFCVVRARETDAAANVGTVATAPTSSESRHALQVYHAAVDDLETSAADIAFLRSIFETERQADFDRANPAAYAAFTGAAYIDFSDQD